MYEYRAKVINVVDGDTFDAIVEVGFHLTATLRFRMIGINTPEKFGKEKELGLRAKEYVMTKLQDQHVQLKTYKSDSFGRWLAEVYIGEENFNDTLVKLGFAKIF